jgi:hypothetical protein
LVLSLETTFFNNTVEKLEEKLNARFERAILIEKYFRKSITAKLLKKRKYLQ